MPTCLLFIYILALTCDELLRMEQLSVCSNPDLVHDSWFKIHKNSSWNMFASPSFREKCGERIIRNVWIIFGNCSIRMNSMLQAIQFPIDKRFQKLCKNVHYLFQGFVKGEEFRWSYGHILNTKSESFSLSVQETK